MILMQNFTYAMQNLNMYDTKHETKTKYLTYITRKMKPPTKMDGKPQAPPHRRAKVAWSKGFVRISATW